MIPQNTDNDTVIPYTFQEESIRKIIAAINRFGTGYSLLYQLPTGGGKTVIFCEIARRFLESKGVSVMILTHRKELCDQTLKTLKRRGVRSGAVTAGDPSGYRPGGVCHVAMVETLKNRIRTKEINVSDVGLVIIDEAHHNSFRKLLEHFPSAFILGVTATPLSSGGETPLNKTYRELLTGESIESLIRQKFLACPRTYEYEVDLQGLVRGAGGDYTIGSSDALYGLEAMQKLLLDSYRRHARGKKTLIFNNGISTSLKVERLFHQAGIPVRHLDNRTPASERKEILSWFRKTRNAVLTSVSILTTGFDEPTVQCVILNRATTSLTLFHQMVGRGARWLSRKRTFTIVDLGNNTARFGHWEEPLDWQAIFDDPEGFATRFAEMSQGTAKSGLPPGIRQLFSRTVNTAFDMARAFEQHTGQPKNVIQEAIRQHAGMCLENADSPSQALELVRALRPDIEMRVKEYVRELGKGTKSYREWLISDYERRLEGMVRRLYRTAVAA